MAASVCVGSPSLLVLCAGGAYCGYIGVVYYCRVVWGSVGMGVFNRVSKILFGAMVCSSFKWLSFLYSV